MIITNDETPTPVSGAVLTLSEAQCRALLEGGIFGRVAVCTDSGPRILPVNYSIVDDAVVFRTSPYGVVATHDWKTAMAFQIDYVNYAEQRGWSVLAVGRGHRVEDPGELDRVTSTWDPRPWAAGSRPLYVRLEWTELTGRRLGLGWTHDNEMAVRRQV
jgi:hypothetical protein